MRVPTGSICGVMSTAALRSKRMTEPSGRRISLATRTTTAFITSPFFTRPRGIASLTETTMTSPTVAYLRLEPPNTLMHMTRRAPELSATSRLVCIWIMMLSRSSLVHAHRRSRYLLLLLAPDHRPALELRDRAMLLDPHNVADRVLVVLVVCVILLRATHGLLHHRMREPAVDTHDARLRLFVAHHDALELSLRHVGPPYFDFGCAARFCRATVRIRAMSRRTSRTRDVFSSCPVARWKRRLNRSFLSLSTSSSSWSTVMCLRSSGLSTAASIYSAMRATKRVLIGSLAAASESASLAIWSGTPPISNMMRPGFTRATHSSGEPLPEPMRTSSGFFET